MESVKELFALNFGQIILGVLVAMSGVTAIAAIICAFFEKVLKKPIRFWKTINNDHELLSQTIKSIQTLSEKHEYDVQKSIEHDKRISDSLNNFITEIRESISKSQNEISQFYENRIHDRKQSLEIQKELTDSIKALTDGHKELDKQIGSLMLGSKELLGNIIDERYEKYISLNGIPINEVEEFEDIYNAYKGLHGNHTRDAKYEYVKNHLPVIPVQTKLIIDKIKE